MRTSSPDRSVIRTMPITDVSIPLGRGAALAATYVVPPRAGGIVVFAHGSGSSRFSPRNQFVAAELQRAGMGTLLLDLLTEEEEALDARTAAFRFDIGLLARRLADATRWLRGQSSAATAPLGYFGASTGAAAALVAAAQLPGEILAVVSRGGRPDLAGAALEAVRAPTLLIVGGADRDVLALNQAAAKRLRARCRLAVIPGATHLFEEAGALAQVAALAGDWFAEAFAPLPGS